MTTTTKQRPSHKVYAVTKTGDRSFWREIGAAWAHQDGDGFNLKLDYLPINGAEFVLRQPDATDAAAAQPANPAPAEFEGGF